MLHREYRWLVLTHSSAPSSCVVWRGQSDGGFGQLRDCHAASDVDGGLHALWNRDSSDQGSLSDCSVCQATLWTKAFESPTHTLCEDAFLSGLRVRRSVLDS